MVFVYNLIMGAYWIAVLLASVFNKKAGKFVKGRKGLLKQLKKDISADDKIIWFHAASLGEFEQGRPVIETIKQLKPQYKILLTFFSPSGYEVRKNYQEADYVYYFPVDFSWQVKKFVDIVKPEMVFFVKYEFWYNCIRILHKRNIKLYCISANFRRNQFFFKWYGCWYRKVLNMFTHIFVQNAFSKQLLESFEIYNVSISGDTRFDRVNYVASKAKQLPVLERFKNSHRIVIAGSTWPPDEKILTKYISSCENNYKYVIAPHEIEKGHIDQLINELGGKAVKYSQADGMNIEGFKVLIIDNIGMLSSIYQYGNIAYIGGGFGKGIHNILEAATFGLPVVFGKNYKKFQEAVDLVDKEGAYSVNDYDSLKIVLDKLLTDPTALQKAGEICRNYISNNTGATSVILSEVINK